MPRIRGDAGAGTGWLSEALAQMRAEAPDSAATEDHLCIAGREVLIRYSNLALAEALSRATRHLRILDHGEPDLTIDCWTALDRPFFVPSLPTTGTTFVDDSAVALTWDAPNGPLIAYDRARRRAWARFSALTGPPPWEIAAPFPRILHWWAADQGLQLAHAAAVGHRTGGVLLVGRSGSGKSTTALACVEGGLGFVGDDSCLLEPSDPPWVHGLYASAKGDENTAKLLPAYREGFKQSPLNLGKKTILFADAFQPESILPGFPLRGVIVPRITAGTHSRISPLPTGAALRALAPSTVLHMPGSRAAGLKLLSGIVQQLPTWELTIGSVPAEAAVLVKRLLDENLST